MWCCLGIWRKTWHRATQQIQPQSNQPILRQILLYLLTIAAYCETFKHWCIIHSMSGKFLYLERREKSMPERIKLLAYQCAFYKKDCKGQTKHGCACLFAHNVASCVQCYKRGTFICLICSFGHPHHCHHCTIIDLQFSARDRGQKRSFTFLRRTFLRRRHSAQASTLEAPSVYRHAGYPSTHDKRDAWEGEIYSDRWREEGAGAPQQWN